MDIFGRLEGDLYRKRGDGSMNQNPFGQRGGPYAQSSGRVRTENPFALPMPEAPPSYSEVDADRYQRPAYQNSYCEGLLESPDNDKYAFLKAFDTGFFIDDSGSIDGKSWREIGADMEDIFSICTQYDRDGIEIHSTGTVTEILQTTHPSGATPTGQCPHKIVKPYLQRHEKNLDSVVITDGKLTDDVFFQDCETRAPVEPKQFFKTRVLWDLKQLNDELAKFAGDEKTLTFYLRAFPNAAPNDYDRYRTIPRIQSLRINRKNLTLLTAFALTPIIQAAPQHISTTWGITISNTLGVGTGLAISVFDDGANTNPVLYWTVYGSWSLSALLVVLFTTFSIKKSSRLRYLCNFALIQFLLTIVIAVSSIGEEGFVAKHLKQWTPLATIAIAGALTVGFERVA
ncbi:hypothetical protein IQ07DRAFT_304257 [Pyrenochaeta sp. DS3sAY3a]|nr:hypothetical protein IQ07DRAFT_304257 [Pyrenochaeta sp. DS3sAY3a]